MTESMPSEAPTDPTADGLKVLVGCEFRFDAAAPVAAIMQVAPSPDPGVRMRREEWHTESDHHGYIDHYSNRCERIVFEPGDVQIAYEAELLLTDPRDLIVPDAAETPVAELPDETLSFIMPSRFCLPDELGNDAWQRFGGVEPGWNRVQTIVDFVHNHLEWVAGWSNPWTTAADAYRAGQGVCRDFAHLAITFCRAMNIPARYCSATSRTSTSPRSPSRWTSPPGSRPTSTAAGTPSTPATTCPAPDASSSGRGRDAVDVALITSFGPLTLTGFGVTAEPIVSPAAD